MTVKQKRLRVASLSVSIVLLVVLIFLMLIMRCQSDEDFSLSGIRFCTKIGEHSILPGGTFCITDVNASYDEGSQVEKSSHGQHFISTATAKDGTIIGKCVAMVPVLGGILDFMTSVPAVSSLIFILFVASTLFFASVGTKNVRLVKHEKLRTAVQFMFSAVTNSYVIGFAKGTIYQGKLKTVCVPGLNCYSCPGAYGACPIGSMQAMFTKRASGGGTAARFPFYVLGLVMLFGVVCGRFVCGFLCPFGLVQDLLHKIKLPKKLKINTFRGDKALRFMKYVILIVFVIALPIFTAEAFPWFCKLICPSGMLIGGIPLMAANEGLRGAAGFFTVLKLIILAIIIILSMMIYRPFCKYICPLGAIYGLLNKVSIYNYSFDESRCSGCDACKKICPMQVDITKNLSSAECIRCGRCVSVCQTGALQRRFGFSQKKQETKNEND